MKTIMNLVLLSALTVRAAPQSAQDRPKNEQTAIKSVQQLAQNTASKTTSKGQTGQDTAKNELKSPPRSVGAEETTASAIGRWVLVAGPDMSFIAPVNTVFIICGKQEKMCTESLASVQEKKGIGNSLDAYSFGYFIVEWSSTRIRAIEQEPWGVREIVLNLVSHTAERSVNFAKSTLAEMRGTWRWTLQ